MAAMLASSSRSFIARPKPSTLCSLARQLSQKPPSRPLRSASTLSAQHEQSSSVSSPLHAQPWEFQSDNPTSPRSRQDQLALSILSAADKKNFAECLKVASQMKLSGVIPDISTYNALMSSAADDGDNWLEAWAIFDDMMAVGVKPDITTFNHLLRAQKTRSSACMWQVIRKMEQTGVSPDTHLYTQIIERFLQDNNLEMAIQYLITTKEVGLVPQLPTAEAVVILAAELGHPRLAIDLIAWFEENSVRRMDHRPWLSCLIASANDLYADGVSICWNAVTTEFKIIPDEGLCIDVLNTCARHGLVDIALQVLDTLKSMNASLQEYHYAPIIQAAAASENLDSGFVLLNDMAQSDIAYSSLTILPMIQVIGSDLDKLDKATDYVESLHRDGVKLTSLVLRALVSAAVTLDDLKRAVGSYKSFSRYGVPPDLATYNVLLEGCVNAAHVQLAELFLSDMRQLKIKKDQDTYEHMVRLYMTQDPYDDAFFYLEDMKKAGFVPSANVYEVIIQTCIANHDSRYSIAVEEMQECGYTISPRILRMLQNDSANETVSDQGSHDTNQVLLDEATQQYIETGGVKSR